MSGYTLVIGNKNYSSWSLRPWLLLKYADIDFDEIIIPLYGETSKQELLGHSSAGKVPVLKDGEDVIWDSLAICEYLHENHPDAGLWPCDKTARAVARCVANEMHSGFFALRNDMPMNVRRTVPDFAIQPDCQRDIDRVIEIWTECRARFGGEGDFLFGEFSIADAMYAPVVTRLQTYMVALPPVAKAYSEAVLSLPAMQDWINAGKEETWVLPSGEV